MSIDKLKGLNMSERKQDVSVEDIIDALETNKKSGLERHLQTLVSGLILLAIVWVGSSVTAQREVTARMEERIGSLKENVAEISNSLKDVADMADIRELKNRLAVLEERMSTCEDNQR